MHSMWENMCSFRLHKFENKLKMKCDRPKCIAVKTKFKAKGFSDTHGCFGIHLSMHHIQSVWMPCFVYLCISQDVPMKAASPSVRPHCQCQAFETTISIQLELIKVDGHRPTVRKSLHIHSGGLDTHTRTHIFIHTYRHCVPIYRISINLNNNK